ncbi:MAG TPA: peptide chain release factor N(5)-glutamine methyltransferase [Terracidiphilus sp.]|jgi:release factor glutamine methyltransferase|nr:peptide chain release factor N(5)-glutamine methyltransferase [Terracidiphilus sp.]
MTLGESLARGEAQLRAGPHPDKARRDAETLLLHLIGKNRAWLLSHLDDDFAGCRSIGYAGLLDRRFRGEPIQYITGQTEFYGLPLRVTPDVLIPRPETEHLVEEVLKRGAARSTPRIVDVGTGSGAIAIALAHEWPNAQLTVIDRSEKALAVARDNAQRTGFAERIRFLHGDLLAPVAAEQFEMVVSNPPYVPAADRDSLAVEVREYEPALALFAGDDGLDVYRRLVPQARAVLAPGGLVVLEIGFGQAQAVEQLLTETGFTEIELAQDLQGIPRVVTAHRS